MRMAARLRQIGGPAAAALAIGGIVCAIAVPKLRRSLGRTTFRTGRPGAPPEADPAEGRPA